LDLLAAQGKGTFPRWRQRIDAFDSKKRAIPVWHEPCSFVLLQPFQRARTEEARWAQVSSHRFLQTAL